MLKHITVIITLLTLATGPLKADCIGCVKVHVEHYPNGKTIETRIKHCTAKQKYIEDEFCPFCKCPRASHSLHKHPYKIYTENGQIKKASELPIQTLLPELGNQQEERDALKNLLHHANTLQNSMRTNNRAGL